jgi:hypothetical protein
MWAVRCHAIPTMYPVTVTTSRTPARPKADLFMSLNPAIQKLFASVKRKPHALNDSTEYGTYLGKPNHSDIRLYNVHKN